MYTFQSPATLPISVPLSLPTIIIWLALQVGNMDQILHYDWLPKWTTKDHLARSGIPTASR